MTALTVPTLDLVDVVVVEDEELLQGFLGRHLDRNFSDKLDRVTFLSRVSEVVSVLADSGEGPLLWVVDLNLRGELTPVREIVDMMIATHRRAALVMMSGEGMANLNALKGSLELDFGSEIFISALAKPFSGEEFRMAIQRALDAMNEEDVEVAPLLHVVAPPIMEPEFDQRFSDFSTLQDLISVLPQSPERIHRYEGMVRELSGLLADALAGFKAALNGSFDDFYSHWSAYFSRDPERDRRLSLIDVLSRIPGADFVLDACVHDVNSVLTPYVMSDRAIDDEEWESLKEKIAFFIDASFDPIDKFSRTGDPRVFWSDQIIQPAFARLGNGLISLDSTIGPNQEIHFPAGALSSAFRTFSSNFRKVRRISGDDKARMQAYASEVGEDSPGARFYFVDDLKPFENDVFRKLFDVRLASENGQGMGTGLLRTCNMVEMAGGSITSFHLRGGVWWEKSPERRPRRVAPHKMNELAPYLQEGSTKIFRIDLPLVSSLIEAVEK